MSNVKFAFLALLLSLTAFADLPKAPASISREKGSIVVTETNGKPRWTAEWTMEPFRVGNRPGVRFTETGRGRYSSFPGNVQWSLQSIWSADGVYKPLRVEKTIRDMSGAVLAIEKKSFDAAGHSIQVSRESPGHAADSKTIKAPADTIAIDGIAAVLRSLPFESGVFETHLLSNEPKLYNVSMATRGREKVRTPAGEFECYKVEVDANLGMLNVVKPFVGKTYFWFTVAPPHFWVRYQGYENGHGTPQIIMELKTYEH